MYNHKDIERYSQNVQDNILDYSTNVVFNTFLDYLKSCE